MVAGAFGMMHADTIFRWRWSTCYFLVLHLKQWISYVMTMKTFIALCFSFYTSWKCFGFFLINKFVFLDWYRYTSDRFLKVIASDAEGEHIQLILINAVQRSVWMFIIILESHTLTMMKKTIARF